MEKEKLTEILKSHRKWANHEEGGIQADLSWADLWGANLAGANLRRADLAGANLAGAKLLGANLRWANLSGAILRGANLRKANLRKANLRKANLRKANLSGANLCEANLTGTCLDPEVAVPSATDEEITAAGLVLGTGEDTGKVFGWRTVLSQHVGDTQYEPGKCYEASWFSVSTETPCHPGVYLAGKEWLVEEYPNASLVQCWCWRTELVHAGDKWRTRRLWVI